MQEVSLTACALNISVRGRQLQRNEPCLDQSRQLAILLLNTRVANEPTEGLGVYSGYPDEQHSDKESRARE